jgi:helicase required for RNAi-mediated heterochromatin assembly 1
MTTIFTSILRSVPFLLPLGLVTYIEKVHVQGYLFTKSGPACRISFSTERSTTKVAWKQSTRLTAGTLVALSPSSDNFDKQCFVAVVAARYLLGGLEPNPEDYEDENTPPRIEIFWSNCDTAVFDPSVEMVMLEAKGSYFETVRHAMVGLQHAAKFE